MSRPKEFKRADVLEKALPLFWSKGFTATGLKDLERATGVNKSGLYSEFKDKDDLFLASLEHYYAGRENRKLLVQEPLGWSNLERFMKIMGPSTTKKVRGCFAVNTLRELDGLSPKAHKLIESQRAILKNLFVANIVTEKTKAKPEAMAEMLLTFYYGLSIEQNLDSSRASFNRKVETFLGAVRD